MTLLLCVCENKFSSYLKIGLVSIGLCGLLEKVKGWGVPCCH